jgi:Phosphotransferase enzyme family
VTLGSAEGRVAINRDKQTDREIYRLIITRRRAAEILLEPTGSGWCLPRLEVQSGQRLAEQLTLGTREEWGLEAYCLFIPGFITAPENALRKKYVLMESIKQNDNAPTSTYWVPSTAAIREATLPDDDCAAARSSLQEVERYVAEPLAGAFGRPRWIKELFQWVQDQIDPLGLRLTGSFKQFNASPTFSLIRIETGGPAVWFKATGEPNVHEMPVTVTVARLFPRHVPELLGVHSSWNGWLSREAPGSTLDNFTEISAWTRTAKALADLQIASIGRSADLLESGCKDLRLPGLIEQIDPFLARMSGLMAIQKKRPPAALTDPELELLGAELKEACWVLQSLALPDTLGHVDFNPGNILISPDGCVFLDWAEGCVTHPLITFEYLREHSRRYHIQDAGITETIAAAYLQPWEAFFSPADLARGLSVSSLVAVFAYAVGGRTWRSPEPLQNPAVVGYLRSLTRRMHREAAEIKQRSELCLN